VTSFAAAVFAPGFFSSGPVDAALVSGGVVSVLSAVVGVFTVIRGQSFAGHALGDIGTTGGSASFLVGVSPLWGFVGIGMAAAVTMELFGVQRARGRDVATGVVFGAALGVSALLLYLDTTVRSTTGATVTILFGSLFTVSGATIPAMVALSAAAFVGVIALYRPLLLSSVSTEMAAAQGVAVRSLGIAFLVTMALAVSLSAVTVGAILSTALLIGPAATALRLTRRPATAMATSALIGLLATWGGILLSYDSYYWPPSRRGWPVSFLVVALIFVFYVMVDTASLLSSRWQRRRGQPGPGRCNVTTPAPPAGMAGGACSPDS
jgi:zinc/manganese transport system permease protein